MSAQEQKLRGISSDVFSLKESMDANTAALQEYIELAKYFKYGLKFLGYVERVAVFIAKIAAAAGTVWAIWKFIILETISRSR